MAGMRTPVYNLQSDIHTIKLTTPKLAWTACKAYFHTNPDL